MPPLPVSKPFSAPNFLALQGPSLPYRDQDRYAHFNRFEDAARLFFNREQRSPRPERSELRSARPQEPQDIQANVIPSTIPISIPVRPREEEIYRFH